MRELGFLLLEFKFFLYGFLYSRYRYRVMFFVFGMKKCYVNSVEFKIRYIIKKLGKISLFEEIYFFLLKLLFYDGLDRVMGKD